MSGDKSQGYTASSKSFGYEPLQCVTQLLFETLNQLKNVEYKYLKIRSLSLYKNTIYSHQTFSVCYCIILLDTESSKKLREEFAKLCFETLLQASFIASEMGMSEKGSLTTLAVKSLLHRCKDVLRKYVQDEKMSGKCPLPRYA